MNSGLSAGQSGCQVGVGIGVDPGVVGEHVVHLVEAVGDRVGLVDVAEVPLADLDGGVALLPQELGDRRGFRGEVVGITRQQHQRERGADRDAAGDERGTAGGALAWP